jgi:hypothetical protein
MEMRRWRTGGTRTGGRLKQAAIISRHFLY